MLKLKYFTADWCGPCKATKPIINEIKSEMNNFDLEFVNVDDNNSEALKYNIRSIPTIVFESSGLELDRMVGGYNKAAYVEKIKQYL